MKKIILCLLTVLTVISLLALPIAANEVSDRPAEQRGEAEQALQNEEAENAEGPAFTTALVGFLEENGSELLGVLTLLGSLLVALLYKTGLLPLLRNGISAIADTAGKTGKMTELFTQKAEEELTAIRESAAPAAEALRKTEEYLKEMSKMLADAEVAWRQTRTILSTETELFYELLASVNLPQAQKDSMAESYYKLRQSLEEVK